jgi:hypothetical protein
MFLVVFGPVFRSDRGEHDEPGRGRGRLVGALANTEESASAMANFVVLPMAW